MTMQLYDLVGTGGLRFSPYCWRAKLALAHKGFAPETIPCKFTEIPNKVAFADHDRVPVLVDEGTAVPDSWRIALYLEDAYADRPSLFGGEAGRGMARFVNSWADSVLIPALAPVLLPDVFDCLDPADTSYFKETREKRFGTSIPSLAERRDEFERRLASALAPMKVTLKRQPFLSGETPLYPDYIVFGSLMWGRCTSDIDLLGGDETLHAWHDRMLDLFDGLARQAPRRAA